MSQTINQNDLAWEKVFDSNSVLKQIELHGFIDLKTEELKAFREPRLMAKIDHSNNRPAIFKKYDLMLFSISNSCYRLGPYELFFELPEWKEPGQYVKEFTRPSELQSLDIENITSENAVLYAALSSGMISDFLDQEVQPTISGRMRTGIFEFHIQNRQLGLQSIKIDGAQVEIDAGLEGAKDLSLIEIKNHISQDFNMRQLYFPMRVWKERVAKPVRTLFLTYTNDVFDFYELAWSSDNNFSAAELIRQERYVFEKRKNGEFSLYQWALVLEERGSKIVADAPFPQADNFERVIDLISILNNRPSSIDYLAQHYDFDQRQSEYYFNAARFLGLAAYEHNNLRVATQLASQILELSPRHKYVEIAKQLLTFAAVRRTYLQLRNKRGDISLEEVVDIVRNSGEASRIGEESTLRRRSQTIVSWAKWLQNNFEV